MGFTVTTANRIDDMDIEVWDQLGAGTPFSSARWSRLAEQIVEDFDARYILLTRDRKPVGRASVAFEKNPGMSISQPLMRAFVTRLLSQYPMVYCHAPPANIAQMSGLILPPGDEVAALHLIHDTLWQIAAVRPSSYLVMGWLSAHERQFIEQLEGYTLLPDSNMVLELSAPSFDKFIEKLSKSARRNFRDNNKFAEEMNLRVERATHYSQHSERLWELINNVDDHHKNVGTTPYHRDAFSTIERDFAGQQTMLLAWAGEKLVGCLLLLHDQGVLRITLIGRDYDYEYVYFQIFYEMVRYAIEHGLQRIYGGTGAEQFKRSLGFQDVPTYIAMTAQAQLLRWLATRIQRQWSS